MNLSHAIVTIVVHSGGDEEMEDGTVVVDVKECRGSDG